MVIYLLIILKLSLNNTYEIISKVKDIFNLRFVITYIKIINKLYYCLQNLKKFSMNFKLSLFIFNNK